MFVEFKLVFEFEMLLELLDVEMVRRGDTAALLVDEIGDIVESISWRSSWESPKLLLNGLTCCPLPMDEADEFLFNKDELVDELLIESKVSTLSLRFRVSAGKALLLFVFIAVLYSLVVDEEELLELDELEGSIWSEADRLETRELASLPPFRLLCWVL